MSIEWEQNRRRADEFDIITITAHGGVHENNLIIGYSYSMSVVLLSLLLLYLPSDRAGRVDSSR